MAETHRIAARGGGLLEYPRLDGTRAEVLAIRDSFQRTFRDGKVLELRQAEASESAFRQAASQYRYIHLATHGFFAPPELRSALVPTADGQERLFHEPGHDITGWHPGLLSGVVFAGANTEPDPQRDDGILTAIEMATLDLSRTELVVLSACDTGLGRTAGGEGLLGLQRACQVAGARSVVASLWQVGDLHTQALMARFYENIWLKKMSKLEALRDAQLAILRGDLGPVAAQDQRVRGYYRAPPQAWAAWVLSGDWR